MEEKNNNLEEFFKILKVLERKKDFNNEIQFKRLINRALILYIASFDNKLDIKKQYDLPKITFETLELLLKSERNNVIPLNIEIISKNHPILNAFSQEPIIFSNDSFRDNLRQKFIDLGILTYWGARDLRFKKEKANLCRKFISIIKNTLQLERNMEDDANFLADSYLSILKDALNISENSKKDLRLVRIEILKRLGHYDQAFKLNQNYLQENPDDISQWLMAGLIKEEEKKYDDALKFYQKAYELEPNDYWPLLNISNALFFLKRYKESEEKLWELVTKFPMYHEIKLNIIRIYIETGKLLEAEEICYQLLENELNKQYMIDTHLFLGKIFRYTNRPMESLYEYNFILNEYPKNSNAMIELAITLRRLGRIFEAKIYFEKLKEEFPVWSEPWYYLGLIYFQELSLDAALECVETALLLNPLDPRSLDLKDQIWYESGKKTKSIDDLKERIRIEKDYKTISVLISILIKEGLFNEVETYKKQLDALPIPSDLINPSIVKSQTILPKKQLNNKESQENKTELARNLVNSINDIQVSTRESRNHKNNVKRTHSDKIANQLKKTDKKKLIRVFNEQTKSFPKSVFYWNNLGQSLFLDGRIEDAKYAFEKTLQIESENIFALNRIARILELDEKNIEALELIEKALNYKGEIPENYIREKDLLKPLKAWILYKIGEKEKARGICNTLDNDILKSDILFRTQTLICLDDGNEKEALIKLNKWLELNPDDPIANELLFRINESNF